MSDGPICTAKHLHHTAIAVKDIHETIDHFDRLFGIGAVEVHEIEDQAVLAALVTIGGAKLELIQPTDEDSGVAKFIERRGEGLHHICFEVDDLTSALEKLGKEGVALIDDMPRKGLAGMIAFLHPKATNGVLVELVDSASVGGPDDG